MANSKHEFHMLIHETLRKIWFTV